MNVLDFLDPKKPQFLPNLSIDHVIVGFENGCLSCLLIKVGDKWVLPGGFIKLTESIESAATRILKERTGLENPHKKFMAVFGNKDRRFIKHWKELIKNFGLPWKNSYWVNNRFVTLAYYSLVNIKETHPVKGFGYEEFNWFDFNALPPTWMDHKEIAAYARNQLKKDAKNSIITYQLLSQPFTMPELHRLHEIILEEKIDRSRFQKKILSLGDLERLPKRFKESPGRNPYQYRVKKPVNYS